MQINIQKETINTMNREILFRGLRTDGQGWAYGYYLHTFDLDYKSQGFDDVPERCHYIIDGNEGCVRVIPETIGQFTTKHDIDSVAIFKDDVLEHNGRRFLIIFEDARFKAVLLTPNKDDFFILGARLWNEAKKIGNIHDNPELLTK